VRRPVHLTAQLVVGQHRIVSDDGALVAQTPLHVRSTISLPLQPSLLGAVDTSLSAECVETLLAGARQAIVTSQLKASS
jgi:hypothetical protein